MVPSVSLPPNLLAVRHVKQGIVTERFREAQPSVQLTFIARARPKIEIPTSKPRVYKCVIR